MIILVSIVVLASTITGLLALLTQKDSICGIIDEGQMPYHNTHFRHAMSSKFTPCKADICHTHMGKKIYDGPLAFRLNVENKDHNYPRQGE
jgi:hypothetical protein